MLNSQINKIQAITSDTLIVGVDIAKNIQWAQFINFRGIEVSKHICFENNYSGFNSIMEKIEEIKSKNNFLSVIVGMEPTGHYWKTFATFLHNNGIKVVQVNPYHTKKAKELDDNSQTKSDKKDALVIAKLIKDGRYSAIYFPEGEYADLRNLSNTRLEVSRLLNICKNRIHACVDEYFPEFETVFKSFIKGKVALHILKRIPFPTDILGLALEDIISVIREAAKKSVGKKKAEELIRAAKVSIGVKVGLEGARIRLNNLLEEYELYHNQLEKIEKEMAQELEKTGYKDILTSIPGIGIISAASFIGEIGDPKRFSNPQQIIRLAGYNLVEDSSGKHKSKTMISKRGRKILRMILYKISLIVVCKNQEIKLLYKYLITRKENPLKKKQALIVISGKMVKIMYSLIKKEEVYDKEKVLGIYRKQQIVA